MRRTPPKKTGDSPAGWRASPRVLAADFPAGGGLAFHLDTRRCTRLNPAAARVFRVLAGGGTIEGAAASLSRAFGRDPAEALEDAREGTRALEEAGLLSRTAASGPAHERT